MNLLEKLFTLTLPAPVLVAWNIAKWGAAVSKEAALFLWSLLRAAFGASTAAIGKISLGDIVHTLAVGLSVGAAVAQGGSEVLGIIAGALSSLAAFVARKQSGPAQ